MTITSSIYCLIVNNPSALAVARFPDWARPSDPELFEGSAHEG